MGFRPLACFKSRLAHNLKVLLLALATICFLRRDILLLWSMLGVMSTDSDCSRSSWDWTACFDAYTKTGGHHWQGMSLGIPS